MVPKISVTVVLLQWMVFLQQLRVQLVCMLPPHHFTRIRHRILRLTLLCQLCQCALFALKVLQNILKDLLPSLLQFKRYQSRPI